MHDGLIDLAAKGVFGSGGGQKKRRHGWYVVYRGANHIQRRYVGIVCVEALSLWEDTDMQRCMTPRDSGERL